MGMMPSPQALSIGGWAQSAKVTSRPAWRAAMAAPRPAGPPPPMKTSVLFCFIELPAQK
jgi:hypothetical protein